MKILAMNAGSTSYKSSLYDIDRFNQLDKIPLWKAHLDWSNGLKNANLTVEIKNGKKTTRKIKINCFEESINQLLMTAWEGDEQVISSPLCIDAIGHRVVHGGKTLTSPIVINQHVKRTINKLSELAPLHNPANLKGIEVLQKIFKHIKHVAVFDTAFHSTLSEVAYTYPGPFSWQKEGIRRYGFHGISHQYCIEQAPILLKNNKYDKIVCCHLGGGASLAAVKNGKSLDTTMGFTPLEGLMMGTRCGSVDPGILLYLEREKKMTAKQLESCLNDESGLKGISGKSQDMREILKLVSEENKRACLAFNMYIHSLKKHLGSMIASLGGIDVLIFTGGVGENSPIVRAKACEGFSFLGLKIDLKKNAVASCDTIISEKSSKIKILIIHTEEDWAIAYATWKLLNI